MNHGCSTRGRMLWKIRSLNTCFLFCEGLPNGDVGEARGTAFQEIRPWAGFETGNFVKEMLGGATVVRLRWDGGVSFGGTFFGSGSLARVTLVLGGTTVGFLPAPYFGCDTTMEWLALRLRQTTRPWRSFCSKVCTRYKVARSSGPNPAVRKRVWLILQYSPPQKNSDIL